MHMTFSIVGCSPDTCQTGVAIASSLMAITSRCAFVRGSIGAVVVQGFSDPRLGPQALELLASGYAPDAVIRALERSEECFEYRQLAVINLHGHTAVHAGSRA